MSPALREAEAVARSTATHRFERAFCRLHYGCRRHRGDQRAFGTEELFIPGKCHLGIVLGCDIV